MYRPIGNDLIQKQLIIKISMGYYPEAKDGIHATWIPSFPDGMTLNTIFIDRFITILKHDF